MDKSLITLFFFQFAFMQSCTSVSYKNQLTKELYFVLQDTFFNNYKTNDTLLLLNNYFSDELNCSDLKSLNVKCNDFNTTNNRHIELFEHTPSDRFVRIQFACYLSADVETIYSCSLVLKDGEYQFLSKHIE